MLHFSCPSCAAALAADDSWVGKRVTCPGCHAPLVVCHRPGSTSSAQDGLPTTVHAFTTQRLANQPIPPAVYRVPQDRQKEWEREARRRTTRTLLTGLAALVALGAVPLGILFLASRTARPNKPDPRAARDAARANAVARNAEGMAALQRKDDALAMARFAQAIKLDPTSPTGYINRGKVYFLNRECDSAIFQFGDAIRLDPTCADAYCYRAEAYGAKGEFSKAIADFEQAIRLDPRCRGAYAGRGLAYDQKGDYQRAIADYDRALRLDPKDPVTYANRGLAYYQRREYVKAIADYDRALRLDPAFGLVYVRRAAAYFAKEEYPSGLADFEQAIRLDPQNADAYNGRGVIHFAKRQYKPAIAEFDRAIRLSPRRALFYRNRAEAYRRVGENANVIHDLTEATRFDPDDAAGNDALAWLLATCPNDGRRAGKKAVEHATRACELSNWKNAAFLDTLAAAHAKCGHFKEAAEWQKRAIELGYEDQGILWKTWRAVQARLRLERYEAARSFREK